MPFAVAAGISEAIAGVAAGIGFGAATSAAIGTGVTGALTGAALGAGTSAITGGDPLKGALIGGVTGGLGGAGAGAALGNAIGTSANVGNALIGAGVGGLGNAAMGGNPLMGAITGGLGGYAGGALTGGGSGTDALTLPNGESIVPPIPPQLNAAGNPLGASTGGTMSGSGDAINPLSVAAAKGSGGDGGSFLGKALSNPSLIMGALSALSSAANKPVQGGYALPGPNSVSLGQKFMAPLTSAPGRTATTPQPASWYTYGQLPEQQFFANNNLKSFGFAKGGALSMPQDEWTAEKGRHVQGPGGPEDDAIPAMLSQGEYILDHRDVSKIGNGSNKRGAKILDRVRKKLDHGGGPLSKLMEAA